jgi:hypothetical protein
MANARDGARFLLPILLAMAGCATAPVPRDAPVAKPGHQLFHLKAVTWTESPGDFPGRVPTAVHFDELAGVRCTARNARGSWVVTTPGTLEVPIGEGAGALGIDCESDGYGREHAEFRCLTPRARSALYGALGGLRVVGMMGPAAIVAAPVVVIGALLAGPLAGGAVGAAVAGPDADTCNYADTAEIVVTMKKR